MSHVGFADDYDPPNPDFDTEDAAMSADAHAARHDVVELLRTVMGVALDWDKNYGHNSGKLGDCEHNAFLGVLTATFDVTENLLFSWNRDQLAAVKEMRRGLGL